MIPSTYQSSEEIKKDGLALYEKPYQPGSFDESLTDRGCTDILIFWHSLRTKVQMEDIQKLIDRQIEYNNCAGGMQKSTAYRLAIL